MRVIEKRTDIAWLAAFRFFFGSVMCVSMFRFIGYGWIDDFWVEPKFHFKYFGFEWVEVLPPAGMHALFWGLALLSFLVAVGAFYRVAACLFAIGFTYLQLIDVATYLNHYYLAVLLAWMLALSPANRKWSVDAWRSSAPPSETASVLWLFLFRFQIGVVYTFAGLAKAQGDWLFHGQPLAIWLQSRTEIPVLGQLFAIPEVAPLMSWAGFLFDTSIPWLLMHRRTRPFAYAAVIGFHIATRTLFPIGMFSVIMVLSALVFFPASWPRTALAHLLGMTRSLREGFGLAAMSSPGFRGTAGVSDAADSSRRRHDETRPEVPAFASREAYARSPCALARVGWSSSKLGLRFGAAAIAVFCLVQVALPFRTHLYGGKVIWHEQGMRFSWRVMLREKNGSVTYVVRNPRTDRTWHVHPNRYLTPIQERELSGQPDLILQLAHKIRDDYRAIGQGPVEVRADTHVSLNGRVGRPLIDPEVDLAKVSDSLLPAAWITPSPSEPPPRLRPLVARR